MRSALLSIFLLVFTGVIAFGQVEAPSINPSGEDSRVGIQITVDCATPGAEIHYTLNGDEPSLQDPVIASGGTLTISRSVVVKAAAWIEQELRSETTTADYRITGSIALGPLHGLALSVTGRTWAWGNQGSGRLGNGVSSSSEVSSPTPVLDPATGTGQLLTGYDICAGESHSLVADQDGTVWAFGHNSYGQLGDNSTSSSSTPVRVHKSATAGDHLDDIHRVAAGQYYSLGLDTSGKVHAWGVGWDGRLGIGTGGGIHDYAKTVIRGDDPAYPDLDGINDISAGFEMAMAVEANALAEPGSQGRVWVWGENSNKQLAQGNTTSSLTRAETMMLDAVNELTDAWDVAAGLDHTVVVRWKDGDAELQGSVWTCGLQANGRLGNGDTSWSDIEYPTRVLKEDLTPLEGVAQVDTWSRHTLAVDINGNVWSWGYNHYGQLGHGNYSQSAYAKRVLDPTGTGYLEDIIMVDAGGAGVLGTSMALASDGTIYVWGRNDDGQLGAGNGTPSSISLPIIQTDNYIDEGHPSVLLQHTLTTTVAPHSVDLEATPSHSGENGLAHIVSVEFFLDGELVGSANQSPWTITASGIGGGPHHAIAIVTDDQGLTSMSPSVLFNPSDLDGDGIPNSWESENGLDPEFSGDGSLDPDQDGLTNHEEYEQSTNPFDKDTDDDYVLDGDEALNL